MKRKSNPGIVLVSLVILPLVFTTCRTDNFEDPPDPFEVQRLEEGYVTFEFMGSDDQFKILTNAENVDTTDKGNIRIRGTIYAAREDQAPVRLSQGDFILLKNAPPAMKTATIDGLGEVPLSRGKFRAYKLGVSGYSEFNAFGGYSEFTLPQVGLTQELEIDAPEGANILFGQGSDLPEEFPVNPMRTYFYFYYDDLASFSLGQSPFMIDRMALDPDDPYFYVHANAMSIPGLESIEDGGFALSVQGYIPFIPQASLSFGNVKPFFNGNFMLQGSINLESVFKVPIVIKDATAVVAFATDNDGISFLNGEEVPFSMGLQGGLVLAVHDLAEFTLGEAAISLFVANYDNFEFSWAGWVSNEIRVLEPIEQLLGWETEGTAWEMIQPPGMVTNLKVWGTIGTDLDDWAFGILAESYLNLGFMTVEMSNFKFYLAPRTLDLYAEMAVGFFGNLYFYGYIFDDGSYGMGAGAKKSYGFDKWGLSIHVGYKVGFDLEGNTSGTWEFCLEGKAYLDISVDWESPYWLEHPELLEHYSRNMDNLKAEISAGVSACLNSDGDFKGKVKFSFLGIGHSFDFKFSLGSSEANPAYNFQDVPLDEVPLENRFDIETIDK